MVANKICDQSSSEYSFPLSYKLKKITATHVMEGGSYLDREILSNVGQRCDIPDNIVMSEDQRVSHVWHDMNQNNDELISLKSSKHRARCAGTLKKWLRSNSGTPLVCVLKGADGALLSFGGMS